MSKILERFSFYVHYNLANYRKLRNSNKEASRSRLLPMFTVEIATSIIDQNQLKSCLPHQNMYTGSVQKKNLQYAVELASQS